MVGVNLICGSQSVHILGPFPAVVVGQGIPYLHVNDAVVGGGLEQIIRPPLHRPQCIPKLTPHVSAEIDHAPRQQCGSERHRETEFHVVAGIVISSSQVHLIVDNKTNRVIKLRPAKMRKLKKKYNVAKLDRE